MSTEEHPYSRLPWFAQARGALREFLGDYHLGTQFVTAALALLAFVGTVGAYLGRPVTSQFLGLGDDDVAVRLEKAFTSDPFLTLLALTVALLVGLSIKRRQLAGKLDGDEHYDVGRALAYGYFKNFLVGALLAARQRGAKLHVFKPANVDQLREFENAIWPGLEPERNTQTIEVTGMMLADRKPLKRRVLVIDQMGGGQGPLLFDFPTTLFTVADYYEAWNRWLREEGQALIPAERVPELQQIQITAFFNHVHRLGRDETGRQAVPEFGLGLAELTALFDEHLELVSIDELKRLLAVQPPGNGPQPPASAGGGLPPSGPGRE